MSEEVKKFDAADAMKSVKERIKEAFVSLIPDDQWNEMVEKEINAYFERKELKYDTRGWASNFTKDVHSVLSEEVKKRVKEYLNSNFSNTWHENGIPVCNAAVEDIITKNAGKILSDMIGGTIQISLSNAGYRI